MPENELVPGKETVVRRRGSTWSFHLPRTHRIELDIESAQVTLSTPHDGSVYELARIEETNDEVIVKLGDEIVGHSSGVGDSVPPPGYRPPEIQDEFERLRGRWTSAGLPQQELDAWAQGASYESHLREIRRRLREHETAERG
jgi:hypothetical protein